MSRRLQSVFHRLLDLLCPPLCPICSKYMEPDEMSLRYPGRALPPCEDCSRSLATPENRSCPRCGGSRFERFLDRNDCRRCMNASFRFRRVIALGEYEAELRNLVLRMKTDRSGSLARMFGAMLVRQRIEAIRETLPDRIVPVPNHRRRRSSRGVNSPDFLAEELGRSLGIPVFTPAIRRVRRTEFQFLLSHRQRLENVRDAFALKRTDWAEKNVLLVDDILTTGATCNELARLLLKHGAATVTVCVVARSEGIYLKRRREPSYFTV